METSTIKLYADCKLRPEKNFMADNIEDFLNDSSSVLVRNNQQYIKHAINLEIKLLTPQDPSGISLSYNKGINYNYCSIQNTNDNKPIYYFIIDKEWVSVGGLKLILMMDTLNSFKLGTDYDLSAKTLIQRQHKDRFYNKYDNKTVNLIELQEKGELTGQYYLSKDYFNFDGTPLVTLTCSSVVLRKYSYSTKELISEISGSLTIWASSIRTIKVDNTSISLNNDYKTDDNYYSLEFKDTVKITSSNFFYYVVFEILNLKRKIDYESENIALKQLKVSEETLIDNKNELTWYYVAISGETNEKPIETYIMPSEEMSIITETFSGTLTKDNFEKGKYYYFGTDILNTSLEIQYKDRNGALKTLKPLGRADESDVCILYRNEDTADLVITRYYSYYYYSFYFGETYLISSIEFNDSIGFRVSPTYYNFNNKTHYDGFKIINNEINTSEYKVFSRGETVTPQKINSIKDLDRTNSRINRVIELPYCPFELKYAQTVNGIDYYTVPEYLSRVTKKYGYSSTEDLYMLNVDVKFFDNIYNTIISDINYKDFMILREKGGKERDILEESKLYHSDYFIRKIAYDSFDYIFNYELLEESAINDNTLRFNFVFSKTLNSRFLFDFNDFKLNRSYEDYNNIMVVNRNNQIPIYNNDYLNYLRTDYNYDVKAKNRETSAQWINAGSTLIGTIAAGATAGNVPGAIVGGIVGLGRTIYGAVAQTESRNAAFKQKKDNLKQQKVTVETSDDIDLLNYYTNHKAKYIEYRISDKSWNSLYDLFYYTGYIENIQEKPDLNTRKNWNYCQCIPDIINTKNLTNPIITDIIRRMQEGFTVFHNNNDLTQELENREVWRFTE